jgi:hypothetical protein
MSETTLEVGQQVFNCTVLAAASPTLRHQSRLPPTHVDALLIWPRGGNCGDLLIVEACERYLE